MERIEVNVITGEQHRVQLTPEEIAEQQAAAAASQPPIPAPPTPAQKLANAGLSVDELKQLLGLAPRSGSGNSGPLDPAAPAGG